MYRSVPPIPMGRPSSNLGHSFNSQINSHPTLPLQIFESNPVPMRRVDRTVRTADAVIPNSWKDRLAPRQRGLRAVTAMTAKLGKLNIPNITKG
jgi:hypothetical protein